jgi:hypothetical protein
MHRLYPDQQAAGVYYSWELAGPDGASFQLYQTPDVTDEQIAEAKQGIRRSQDVVSLQVLKVRTMLDYQP